MNSKGQHYGSPYTSGASQHISDHSGNAPTHKPYGSSKGWHHHAEGSCGSHGGQSDQQKGTKHGNVGGAGEQAEKGKENKIVADERGT